MRISVDQRDSGHRTYLAWGDDARLLKVRLNGESLTSCITADEELGEVLIFQRDDEGRPIVSGDEVLTEWRRGNLEIVRPERG